MKQLLDTMLVMMASGIALATGLVIVGARCRTRLPRAAVVSRSPTTEVNDIRR